MRRFDPATDEVTTVADGLAEPSDVVLAADGGVLVVESAAHRLTRLAPGTLAAAGISVDGARHRTERPPTELAPGQVTLDVIFTPAPGQKLDDIVRPVDPAARSPPPRPSCCSTAPAPAPT